MGTKRTPLRRDIRRRITPDAIAAFAAGNWMALHRALGLKPWEANPLDVPTNAPAPGTMWSESVPHAMALRADLVTAASATEGRI